MKISSQENSGQKAINITKNIHVKYRQKTLFLVLYGQSRLKTSEHEIIVNMTMNLGMKVKACVKVLIRGHSHLILHHLGVKFFTTSSTLQ